MINQETGNGPITLLASNGWMFGIPVNRSSWGYLYNNKVTTKEEALRTHIDSLENIGFPDNILITINLEIT